MLGWALTFLVVAIIAAVLGFGGIAGFAVEIAKIIFFVAIVLFVISALFFIVSSIRNGDIVGLLGGVFFLLACMAFLASYLGGAKD